MRETITLYLDYVARHQGVRFVEKPDERDNLRMDHGLSWSMSWEKWIERGRPITFDVTAAGS